MAIDTPLTWSVVIPVKVLAIAKSRLAGLDDADRRALALAMAADTVAAAVACPLVGAVVVVSDDPAVTAEVAPLGAVAIADTPGAGLNRALAAGADHAAERWPANGLAALLADLPSLSASDLKAALTAASAVAQAFVADAAGSGTTLYTARSASYFRPQFGPRSRSLHLRAGATELSLPGIAGLRQDVDTLADLRAAAAIGLGRRTTALAMTDRVRAGRW
ncbi:MAG TPA: 2-phospho-L-lactate guanylyltransferase [Streptosporangiaceae bacterium]|nr:2-phospho-L-lactate guanylyltransferase [Streptosporangiaceae bacterium]